MKNSKAGRPSRCLRGCVVGPGPCCGEAGAFSSSGTAGLRRGKSLRRSDTSCCHSPGTQRQSKHCAMTAQHPLILRAGPSQRWGIGWTRSDSWPWKRVWGSWLVESSEFADTLTDDGSLPGRTLPGPGLSPGAPGWAKHTCGLCLPCQAVGRQPSSYPCCSIKGATITQCVGAAMLGCAT